MRVVIDTNIAFSAILNTNSKISKAGDKELIKGMKRQKWNKLISTNELYKIIVKLT